MDDRLPTIPLKRDDFPTFGLPTIAILGTGMVFIVRHFIILSAYSHLISCK
jgi:hypothetical protein